MTGINTLEFYLTATLVNNGTNSYKARALHGLLY